MSEQLLFEVADASHEWIKNGPAPGEKFAEYYYGDTGWMVRHCGHPTAIFPYMIYSPTGEMLLAPNGRGWQFLKVAQFVVERVVLTSATVMELEPLIDQMNQGLIFKKRR